MQTNRQPGLMCINLIIAGLLDSLPLLASDLAGRRCGSKTPRRNRVNDSGKVMTAQRERWLLLLLFYDTCLVELVFCLSISVKEFILSVVYLLY